MAVFESGAKMELTKSRTASGLTIETVKVVSDTATQTYAHEHPWLVRFTHWLNAISLVVLTMSGLQIFMAFPSFGPKIPQKDLLNVPEFLRLGGWLGGSLQWHLSFIWLFSGTGLIYVIYLFTSGHWRKLIFQPRDINGVWPMVRHYFFFKPKPEETEPYNPLQKLAYTSTIFLGIISVITGFLLYQPTQFAFLVGLLGGFGMVRLFHFAAMAGFLAFIPGHLLMVALHGWNNFYSMLTGWKRRSD
jgi:Ni/Fe-hydrogenase b-type cytochrome subunit